MVVQTEPNLVIYALSLLHEQQICGKQTDFRPNRRCIDRFLRHAHSTPSIMFMLHILAVFNCIDVVVL